ncbi:hypothetical protein ONE63_003080 [Megalurothrips usitatus]|uniref:Uncharacterized protein n=1 Tax=Megalurothrips usitatus TaxID=439358 RepID=A0AAV7XCS6_9NEOP|nr:hypothetical protein ONE63_003080 [Megalurothrips usitatus]
MDIRRVPASQHHGLALMADGEMIVAGDVWTLAVSLDMAGFRKTVRRLTTNAAVMRVLARNFTELARSSNQASPDTQEFADTIGALLDSEVAAVQDDLAIATKHLKSLEMATPASRPSPLPDSPAVPELLSRPRRAWIDIGGAALKTVFGVATQRDLSRLQARLGSLGKREIGQATWTRKLQKTSHGKLRNFQQPHTLHHTRS